MGLADRGLVRMEVIVPEKDKDIVKALAERLTANVSAPVNEDQTPTGAEIWTALNGAPASLGELQFDRSRYGLRTIDL